MNAVLRIFLAMSASGALLILALLLGRRLLQNKISRQWQYYIWLVVVLRLLLPFGAEVDLRTYPAVDQVIAQAAPLLPRQAALNISGDVPAPAAGLEADHESADRPAEELATARPLQEIGTLLIDHIWLVWLVAALGLLTRKVTIYQGFMRYIRAGSTPVSDIEILDRFSAAVERAGVKKPVELCVNPLISSPLLTGFFHPCVVLPRAEYDEKSFQHIVLHELTHYKRGDMFYKWFVQITVCLHWFNPLVHLMSREIARACEFSCDEAVLTKMGGDSARDYGKTLLDAMAAVGRYKENLGAVTLSENKRLLKERLCAIMNFRRRSTAVRLLTGALTLCVIFGAAFIGVYPAAAASELPSGRSPISGSKNSTQAGTDTRGDKYAWMAEKYYEANSLPLFQMAFSRLDEEARGKWLDRLYADGQLAFWGAAVDLMDEDRAQIQRLAETIYKDGSVAYFSALAMHMSEDMLEKWLDRALEDGNWAFQSVLFNALDRDDEFDELKDKWEKEWEEAQRAEYGAAGITMDGKDYYYQGELVDIFLDIRSNRSFYTLNMNPKGTVNIRIVRSEKNEITGVAYMTEAEVAELFGDMDAPDDLDMEIIPVDLKAITDGETVFLGEYTLSEGDEIWYDILVETGKGIQVFFAEDAQENVVYWSVHNLRQPGEPLKCTADFTVEPPGKPGTYKLFIRAADGALENVRGSVSIGFAAGAS